MAYGKTQENTNTSSFDVHVDDICVWTQLCTRLRLLTPLPATYCALGTFAQVAWTSLPEYATAPSLRCILNGLVNTSDKVSRLMLYRIKEIVSLGPKRSCDQHCSCRRNNGSPTCSSVRSSSHLLFLRVWHSAHLSVPGSYSEKHRSDQEVRN